LIVKQLRQIAEKESVHFEEAALDAIARGADGGMRDAESALDQLISFCGTEIAEADVLAMFGLAAQGQILALSEAVLAGEAEGALRQLNELALEGKDLGRLVSELLQHFRNLLIYQVSRGDLNLIEATENEAAVLAKQSARLSPDGLTRVMDVLTDCEGRLRDTASRKILLEVTLLKMIEARNAVSIDAVLRQLQQLRAEAGGGLLRTTGSKAQAAIAPTAATMAAPAAAVRPAAPPAAGPISISSGGSELEQLWSRLVEAVGRASPFVRSYFIEAHPVSFAKNLLTIGFDPEFAEHLALVDNTKNHALLQTKLAELGCPNAQVKFVQAAKPSQRPAETASPPAPAPAPVAAPPAARPAPVAEAPRQSPPAVPAVKDDFKNDPLIQKALEIFKGQIVDVRS
jgi:DNA polymerase-3 subunit gamma/tau